MKYFAVILGLVLWATASHAAIVLESVEAIPDSGRVTFNWVTTSEYINYLFDCRRDDSTMATVTGHMTTTERNVYQWIDTAVVIDTLYNYDIFAIGNDPRDTVGIFNIRPPHWVAVTSFVLMPGDGGVSMSWATLCELNNDHFEIARDGIVKGGLGAHENCTTLHHYSWVDTQAVNGTTYTYTLTAILGSGARDLLETGQTTPNDVDTRAVMPGSIELTAYPNPFNPSATLSFSLAKESRVRLIVYDMNGREVRVLTDGVAAAGENAVQFNGSDLPSGLYFARLQTGEQTITRKLLLMK
jgi:hypothetical protein